MLGRGVRSKSHSSLHYGGTREFYKYSSLTKDDSIRLIVLQPSEELAAGVQCSLIHTTLTECDDDISDHYIALSYVWGDEDDRSVIIVDGKRLNITASLESALRHIRHSHRVLRVWADGICINQIDVDERNQQVSHMGLIYSIAQHTIIFLGSATPQSDATMEFISSRDSERSWTYKSRIHFEDEFDNSANSPGSSESEDAGHIIARQGQDHIMARPWFSRVWILQELVLSVNPWLQCGKFRVKWDIFSSFVRSRPKHTTGIASRWTLSGMNDARSNYKRLSFGPPSNYDGDGTLLLNVLTLRRGLGVSDPRDMIYAHLGMIDHVTRLAIPVDYSRTCVEVYEGVALLLTHLRQDYSILFHVEEVELDNRREGLPSWVPDWALPYSSNIGNGPIQSIDPFYDDFLPCIPDYISFAAPHVLAIRGCVFGSVKDIIFESSWPDYDSLLKPPKSTGTQLQTHKLMEGQPNLQRAIDLLLQFHKPSFWQLRTFLDRKPSSAISDLSLSAVNLGLERDLFYPLLPIVAKQIGDPPLAQFEVSQRAESMTMIFLHNLKVFSDCYSHGKNIAILENGVLAQVPASAQVGDTISRFNGCLNPFLVRPWSGIPSEDSEADIIQDLAEKREKGGGGRANTWTEYVQHFSFVTAFGDVWEGLETFGLIKRGPVSKPLVFALH